MTDPMSPNELQACRERAEAVTGLTPDDVRGGAFTWDGDDSLLADVVATADALAALRADVPRLLVTVDALQVRTENAEGKAQQFERDWYDAKAEFGAASAKLAATIAAREEEIAALRARLRRDMVAGLSARRALASGTTVIELLREAIEAYITEGPDDGPNDGPEEKALAELLAAIDDFNGSHRAVGAKWLRVMTAVPAFLSASADQVRDLRVAWEAFEAAEYTESAGADGARLVPSEAEMAAELYENEWYKSSAGWARRGSESDGYTHSTKHAHAAMRAAKGAK